MTPRSASWPSPGSKTSTTCWPAGPRLCTESKDSPRMDTMPMPLESLAAAGSRLEDFRVTTPAEITAMLKRLVDGNTHIGINAPNGVSITATLWTIDSQRGMLSFSVVADEPNLEAVVECDEAVVVGYLDSVKVQFDV